MNRNRLYYCFTLVAAIALLLLAGCSRKDTVKPKSTAPPPANAHVIEVQSEPFVETLSITGSLVSRAVVDVKAETIGRIVRFDKEEGDAVAAGETVLWVDDAKPKLAVREAESAVQVAQAQLERIQVLEEHDQAELERAGNLLRSGGITDKDLKSARVAAHESRAQVALAKAQLEQAKAALATTHKRLADCEIKSPLTGEIFKKYTNKGAYVEAPTAVFSLVDNQRLELESQVAASDLGAVREHQAVRFTVASYPGELFSAQVTEISPAVDVDSRSAKVRIRVPNPSRRLKAGMFVQGEIVTGTAKQAVLIPVAAVYRDDQSAKDSYVFVVAGGHAQRRKIRIGRELPGRVEIIEGLKPGELLVAERSIELADGVTVHAN